MILLNQNDCQKEIADLNKNHNIFKKLSFSIELGHVIYLTTQNTKAKSDHFDLKK